MCLDVAYLDMLITVLVNETCDQRDAEVQLLSLGLQSSWLTETKPPACSRRSLRGKQRRLDTQTALFVTTTGCVGVLHFSVVRPERHCGFFFFLIFLPAGPIVS